MKLFEKFASKNTPEAEKSEVNTINRADLDPELQIAVKELNEHITHMSEGLVDSNISTSELLVNDSRDVSHSKTITLGNESIEVSYYNGAGIGYNYTAEYNDGGINVKLTSGADFDTAQEYSRVEFGSVGDEKNEHAVRIEVGENQVTAYGQDVQSGVDAATKVLASISAAASNVNAKGA